MGGWVRDFCQICPFFAKIELLCWFLFCLSPLPRPTRFGLFFHITMNTKDFKGLLFHCAFHPSFSLSRGRMESILEKKPAASQKQKKGHYAKKINNANKKKQEGMDFKETGNPWRNNQANTLQPHNVAGGKKGTWFSRYSKTCQEYLFAQQDLNISNFNKGLTVVC